MNRWMKTTYMATILAVASAQAVAGGQAEKERKAQGSGPNPYVECGIGGALFPTVGWAAAISNVIWDIGTTAIISATASPETCNAKKKEMAKFILDNYDQLAEETARGEGEHLNAMFDIAECNIAHRAEIVSGLRARMSLVIANPSYQHNDSVLKASDMFNALDSTFSEESAHNCSAS